MLKFIFVTCLLVSLIASVTAQIPNPNLLFLVQGWNVQELPITVKHQVVAVKIVNTEDAEQVAEQVEIRGYNRNTREWYIMPECDVIEPGVEYEISCVFERGVIIIEDPAQALDMRELGDVNGDYAVNILDLNIVKTNYGKELR